MAGEMPAGNVTGGEVPEPTEMVLRFCSPTSQIIELKHAITDLKALHCLPLIWEHSAIGEWMWDFENDYTDTMRRLVAIGNLMELQADLLAIGRDTQQAGQDSSSLRTWLANALTLAARVSLLAIQSQNNKGQKFPDSPACSGWNRTQL
jgi:hypothetical protein